MSALLSVRDLQVHFFNDDGITRAVDGVSFELGRGETLGIVGESGCGKSVTSLSILGLLPPKLGRVVGGSIVFDGRNVLTLNEAKMRDVRGAKIAMIFQEPMTSLNPVHRVGEQIAEAIRVHEKCSPADARQRALDMMRVVRIPDVERRYGEYPHQFSGGMRQRAMIAMALVCRPALLIADEPTTALDVTIQAQILQLIAELKAETGTAVMMITHDLGVVAETCERVMVMYAGRKIEEAEVDDLFERPAHPYTIGLMAAKPRIGETRNGERLREIPGLVPSLRDPIAGCAFAPRCAFAKPDCHERAPELRQIRVGHLVACHEAEAISSGAGMRA